MPQTDATTSRVGIRALRQNLSVYLRRIHRGERFEVTDRGRPVALLIPLAGNESPLTKLIAQGRASSPKGDLLDLDSACQPSCLPAFGILDEDAVPSVLFHKKGNASLA